MRKRREAKPIFEGVTQVVASGSSVTVLPPTGVVVPPGYEVQTFLTVRPQLSATYKVVKAKGWKARYLRWRFPWTR